MANSNGAPCLDGKYMCQVFKDKHICYVRRKARELQIVVMGCTEIWGMGGHGRYRKKGDMQERIMENGKVGWKLVWDQSIKGHVWQAYVFRFCSLASREFADLFF